MSLAQTPPVRPAGELLSGRIPLKAVVILAVLCFLWGGNAVAIKFSSQGLPPMAAAALRSIVSGFLVWVYARSKGRRVIFPVGQRRHALVIGLLFGTEFLLLYWGLSYTPASRASIFVNTNPFWVALGAHFLLKSDRLTMVKAIGLILAFAGVAAVFRVSSTVLPPDHLIGDMMELTAGALWAATTLYIKRISETVVLDHYQTLFAQLFWALPVLLLGSILWEFPLRPDWTPLVLGAVFYQSVIVAFASYLVWFWLIHRHTVSRLVSFTFLSPMFGVILGGLVLGEPITLMVWLGLACVGAGLYLVNR